MDKLWLGMTISVLFSKNVFEKWFLKGPAVDTQAWWMGSTVVVFEKESRWETTEIPGWFSRGDFVLY
jgi:hypothetical protein